MAETKAVINSQPLTAETNNEGQGFKPFITKQLVHNQIKSCDAATWSFSKIRIIFQTEMEKASAYNKQILVYIAQGIRVRIGKQK